MNRLVRPVAFTFEADVVQAFARLTFGAAGAVTLNQGPYPAAFSKGFCNAAINTVTGTATTSNTSASVTALASLSGLIYNGMSVSGTGIPANTTISAYNPTAGTFTLSNAATADGTLVALTFGAKGGQYILQLGRQAGVQLDTYNHLLGLSHVFDVSGVTAGTTPVSPAAPSMFLVRSRVAIRTVPATSTSAQTDATFIVQFGTYSAGTFASVAPASGEVCRLTCALTRSGAI